MTDKSMDLPDLFEGAPDTKQVSVTIPYLDYIYLEDYCRKMQRKRGDVLREAIYEYMKSKGILTLRP